MNIADAMHLLQESEGQHLYDVIIPSLNSKMPFKPMTVGHHKTMAKMAINDESNFNKFLCALIFELSNEKIDFSKINEMDKMAILFQIKQHNSPDPLRITLECPECNTKLRIQPDLEKDIKEWLK